MGKELSKILGDFSRKEPQKNNVKLYKKHHLFENTFPRLKYPNVLVSTPRKKWALSSAPCFTSPALWFGLEHRHNLPHFRKQHRLLTGK